MRVLDLDVPGLDLVLGGGLRMLERVKGRGESATLLIRGPAGSGKTVMGTQLAASIARKLETDVAYGCVELLPVELRAQHESVRSSLAREQVVLLSEPGEQPDASYVRIYSGLLDLGEGAAEESVSKLEGAVEVLLAAAERQAGRKVRVLVIDSLADGYGLGSKAPRLLADGICKLAAARGLVVVLLEEMVDVRSSAWSFAVDVVLELRTEQGLPEHRLWVTKNRLGPVDVGPHRFTFISHAGIRIYPRPSAYRRSWARDKLMNGCEPRVFSQSWGMKDLDQQLPPFRECVTAVVGLHIMLVGQLAFFLGQLATDKSSLDSMGSTIFYRIGPGELASHRSTGQSLPSVVTVRWGMLDSGAELLSHLRDIIAQQRTSGRVPHRVVIGDLRDVVYHSNEKEMIQSLSTAVALLRELRVPTILFETVDHVTTASPALALADVGLAVESMPESMSGFQIHVMNRQGHFSASVTRIEHMPEALNTDFGEP